jgi:AcrR family transcriptional regulator
MDAISRRERLRAEMHEEILRQARRQVAEGGPEALSLNAIARELGTSGPALYRYFSSREELLVAVAASAYDDLAAALRLAADGARRRRPAPRFRAVAAAYRQWALEHPSFYRLIFGEPVASGQTAPGLLVPAADRAMDVLVDVLGELPGDPDAVGGALRGQLTTWAAAHGRTPPAEPAGLARAVRAWTRMHGVVSLELMGAFQSMGLDGGALFAAEVESILG